MQMHDIATLHGRRNDAAFLYPNVLVSRCQVDFIHSQSSRVICSLPAAAALTHTSFLGFPERRPRIPRLAVSGSGTWEKEDKWLNPVANQV
jgi:hypothetical protein